MFYITIFMDGVPACVISPGGEVMYVYIKLTHTHNFALVILSSATSERNKHNRDNNFVAILFNW